MFLHWFSQVLGKIRSRKSLDMLILLDASLAEHLTFNQFASGYVACKLLILLGALFGSPKFLGWFRMVLVAFWWHASAPGACVPGEGTERLIPENRSAGP